MAMSPVHWTNICAFVGLGLAVCTAAPATVNICQTCVRGRPRNDEKELYEDEDGVATLESQKRYTIRTQAGILIFTNLSGFFSGLAAYICLEIPYLHSGLVRAHNVRAVEAFVWLAIWVNQLAI